MNTAHKSLAGTGRALIVFSLKIFAAGLRHTKPHNLGAEQLHVAAQPLSTNQQTQHTTLPLLLQSCPSFLIPVGKSGAGVCRMRSRLLMSGCCTRASSAATISAKLWGGILVAMPTAIPCSMNRFSVACWCDLREGGDCCVHVQACLCILKCALMNSSMPCCAVLCCVVPVCHSPAGVEPWRAAPVAHPVSHNTCTHIYNTLT